MNYIIQKTHSASEYYCTISDILKESKYIYLNPKNILKCVFFVKNMLSNWTIETKFLNYPL